MMKKLMLTHALIMVFSVGWTVLTETIVLICIIPVDQFTFYMQKTNT